MANKKVLLTAEHRLGWLKIKMKNGLLFRYQVYFILRGFVVEEDLRVVCVGVRARLCTLPSEEARNEFKSLSAGTQGDTNTQIH